VVKAEGKGTQKKQKKTHELKPNAFLEQQDWISLLNGEGGVERERDMALERERRKLGEYRECSGPSGLRVPMSYPVHPNMEGKTDWKKKGD